MKCSNCGFEFEGKFCPECGTKAEAPAEQALAAEKVTWNPSVKTDYIEVDEGNKLWGVKGVVDYTNPKSGHGFLRATAAIMTCGLSLDAEGAVKGVQKLNDVFYPEDMEGTPPDRIYRFNQLIGYELVQDETTVSSGSFGGALAGGMLFGDAGLIAGSILGSKAKKIVEKLIVKITVDDLQHPCMMVPIITKKTKTSSKEYMAGAETANRLMGMLSIIAHRK